MRTWIFLFFIFHSDISSKMHTFQWDTGWKHFLVAQVINWQNDIVVRVQSTKISICKWSLAICFKWVVTRNDHLFKSIMKQNKRLLIFVPKDTNYMRNHNKIEQLFDSFFPDGESGFQCMFQTCVRAYFSRQLELTCSFSLDWIESCVNVLLPLILYINDVVKNHNHCAVHCRVHHRNNWPMRVLFELFGKCFRNTLMFSKYILWMVSILQKLSFYMQRELFKFKK